MQPIYAFFYFSVTISNGNVLSGPYAVPVELGGFQSTDKQQKFYGVTKELQAAKCSKGKTR
jgi:hypothetical protein